MSLKEKPRAHRAITPTVQWLGDRALVLYFPQEISTSVHQSVLHFSENLKKKKLPEQLNFIPAYASLTVLFSKTLLPAQRKKILGAVAKTAALPLRVSAQEQATVEIPVSYGGEDGPDLDEVAALHHLSVEEVIRLHTEPVYEVFQIGFTPGFPYLGGLLPELRTARRSNPRTQVPAGSVGIGDAQTGVYSVDGPGGWQIIGKTDLPLFDANREKPALLRAGMKVKFVSRSFAKPKDLK
jgi:inhibitor of KinA